MEKEIADKEVKLTTWQNEPSVTDLNNDLLAAEPTHKTHVNNTEKWYNKSMSKSPLVPVLNSCRLEEGTVEYVDADKEGRTFIYVRCDNRKIHPTELPLHSLTRCYPLNAMGSSTAKSAVKPTRGTKCLIVFKNPGTTPKDFAQGYYLGALEEKSTAIPLQNDIKAAEGSFIHKTEKGSRYIVTGKQIGRAHV